jgi:Flp pilus assembly protein TadB
VTLLTAVAIGVAIAALGLAASAPVSPSAESVRWPAALHPVALLVRWRARRRRERAAAGSIGVLQSTCAALRSGLPLATALRVALDRTDPSARGPFERALLAFDLNAALDEALRAAAKETHDHRLGLALEALALAAGEQLPATRAAAVIASVADRLVFEERLLEEVRARTSGVRAQIVLLALLVPGLASYLVVTMPSLAVTLGTPLGTHVLLPAAFVFELAGILASRTIVRRIAT